MGGTPPPRLQTKVTIVGKNEVYRWESLVTVPTNYAQYLQTMHSTYKLCTVPTNYAQYLQTMHSTYKLCTVPTNYAQYLQTMHSTYKLCTVPTNYAQYLQTMHSTYKLCTVPTNYAQYLQTMHSTYKLCTGSADSTAYMYMRIHPPEVLTQVEAPSCDPDRHQTGTQKVQAIFGTHISGSQTPPPFLTLPCTPPPPPSSVFFMHQSQVHRFSSPLHFEVLKLCAFEWLQSSCSWWGAVLNKVSLPKVPTTPLLSSTQPGSPPPPLPTG